MALLLPALAKARAAARRTACRNNTKQIVAALRLHESSHGELPVGAQRQATVGVSWLVPTVQYLDAPKSVQEIDTGSRHAGSLVKNLKNAERVDGVTFSVLRCPSTTFPALKKVGFADAMMPSYVGLSGAMGDATFAESRTSRCCRQDPDGETSSGGVLVPNKAVSLMQISDGLSQTLCIGETSREIIDAKGKSQRIDGGFPAGWIAGTSAEGTPPNFVKAAGSSSWNITTIRYLPNTSDYELPESTITAEPTTRLCRLTMAALSLDSATDPLSSYRIKST